MAPPEGACGAGAMTRDLLPFQSALLHELADSDARHVQIQVTPGAGLTEVLSRLAAGTVDEGGSVVVVVGSLVLAQQWLERLRALAIPAEDLRATSNAVEALDSGLVTQTRRPGVIVTTPQALMHGAGKRTSALLRPSLLIVERPGRAATSSEPSALDAAMADLATRAVRVIVLTSSDTTVPWLTAPARHAVSFRDVMKARRLTTEIRIITYLRPPEEGELRAQAVKLLDRLGGEAKVGSSRADLHAALVRLASRLSGEQLADPDDDGSLAQELPLEPSRGTLDELWALVDEIENLGDDERLTVVAALTREALSTSRPVLVIADRVDDAEYVGSRLRSEHPDVAVLSGSSSRDDTARVFQSFDGRSVLVITRMLLQGWETPPGTRQIWWSPPRTAHEAMIRLTRGQGEAVALIGDPPTPAEAALRAVLDELMTTADVHVESLPERR